MAQIQQQKRKQSSKRRQRNVTSIMQSLFVMFDSSVVQ
eukprot:SAG31_NODE_16932_length_690_cov_0.751269_1_plen_37_part_10